MNILRTLICSILCLSTISFGGRNTRADEPDTEMPQTAVEDGYAQVVGENITLRWQIVESDLNVRISAPTTGWVAVGFDPTPDQAMRDANIIIGFVDQEGVHLRDDYGSSFTSHNADAESSGQDNISNAGGSEVDGSTQLSFTIPLSSGDSRDRDLVVGNSYSVILASGAVDSFNSRHTVRTIVVIQL